MHASTAQAAAQAQQRQDLRSPDAIDAAQHPRKTQAVDAPGATVVDSQSTRTPVAPAAAPTDDGVDWVTIGIGLAGTLLVLGGIAVVTSRTRSTPRTRVSV